MTDRDPARPPHHSPATPVVGATDDVAASGDVASGDVTDERGTALRDRWWWSPTLAIVLGAVVIGYQLDAVRAADALWLNWAVAALGAVAVLYGAVALLRAYRSR